MQDHIGLYSETKLGLSGKLCKLWKALQIDLK